MHNDKPISQAILNLVDSQLKVNSITDLRVLKAIGSVERSDFTPTALQSVFALDRPMAIRSHHAEREERFMLSPLVFAKMLQYLDIKKNDVVLDIGCATGYSSAVLSKMAMSVIAIDSDADLVKRANQLLLRIEIGNVAVIHSEHLADGYPQEAPYNAIIIEGAVESLDKNIFEQLAIEGRLAAIMTTQSHLATVYLYEKINATTISRKPLFETIHPVLEGFSKEDVFVF